MSSPWAMAGLAEAAVYYTILIGHSALWAVGIAAAIGFFGRSRIAAAVALALAALVAWALQPWRGAFAPIDQSDSEQIYWLGEFRWYFFWWILTSAIALLVALYAFAPTFAAWSKMWRKPRLPRRRRRRRRRKSRRPSPEEASEP